MLEECIIIILVDKFRKMDGNDVILIFEESFSLFPKNQIYLPVNKTIILYKR